MGFGGYMENKNEYRNSAGKPRMSRFSTLAMVLLYFLVGMAIGWFSRPTSDPKLLFDAFHTWFYHAGTTWGNSGWLGVQIEKSPLDTWVYQEIIYETKPDVLVEAGTYKGGSALYFASIFDLLKRGRVLTIDIVEYPGRPQNQRITYLLGSSTSDAIFQQVRNSIHPGEKVMVSLDSDHHKDNVLKELRLYSGLVTPGNYLVVEDTDINGHPVLPRFGPGPMEAVEEFLKNNSDFIQDRSREKFGVTLFPGGWLKKVR
jgi:cephalosporin hydroxylase